MNGYTPRQILESMGMPAGEKFEKREYVLKDTLAYDGAESLTSTTIFSDANKSQYYQDGRFPITNQGIVITHLLMHYNIAFDVDDAKQHKARLQHFLENSFLRFQLDNDEVLKTWLFDIAEGKFFPGGPESASPYVDTVQKFNNWCKLQVPIVVGAGKSLEVKFEPAPSLTTEAVVATDAAYIPDWKPANSLSSHHGWFLTFWAKAWRFYEQRAV